MPTPVITGKLTDPPCDLQELCSILVWVWVLGDYDVAAPSVVDAVACVYHCVNGRHEAPHALVVETLLMRGLQKVPESASAHADEIAGDNQLGSGQDCL